jgi:DNA end-binding protein Ku
MPARSIGHATISFGLVAIPVKLYVANKALKISYHHLHAADLGRLKQLYQCQICEQKVERTDIVHGYERARDQLVLLEPFDLQTIQTDSDHTIAIEEFVPLTTVDPIYYEKTNLLGPDKGGDKGYQLLYAALRKTDRVAIARYSSRGREPLVLLRASSEGLVMHTLFYADEVRSFGDVPLGGEKPLKKDELALAVQLVEQRSNPSFHPQKWNDEYRERLQRLIDTKAAGGVVPTQVPEAPTQSKTLDLVQALKQSIHHTEAARNSSNRRKASKSTEAARHRSKDRQARISSKTKRATAKRKQARKATKTKRTRGRVDA